MPQKGLYTLPPLPYGYGDLIPFLSSEQLKIHHAAYVTEVNNILEKLDKDRKEGSNLDIKGVLKALSFNLGGHVLHSMFWANMMPANKARKEPSGSLSKLIKKEFGTFERFRKEFSLTASSVEGSGWVALTYCNQTGQLLLMQIEKHNTNIYPTCRILMVLDMFEHAYYIDYKNEKKKYIETFWNVVNWEEISRRLED
ncbi:MAG: superoxide dismutase [Candidatus Woykebacteria bacterium RBG_13_40_15]|uniref:Superoxide dismutase n=1 Tax=Candidatus Woykebacteria bacterium RBG_13_40_15 TaxID=1802593 RepID=A0A1G1W7Z6_9BACT|nr:MAG: superoxide dismutase [Candidatus Woykebacteria bacterium RBG_13_40_15]